MNPDYDYEDWEYEDWFEYDRVWREWRNPADSHNDD